MSGQAPLQVRDLELWCGLLAPSLEWPLPLDVTKPQCALFATVFVVRLPSTLLQGRCICDGSLSSPIAWLFQMLPEKPLREA